ncbi:histidine kinase/DNA gyrase B/HSP90-like ATPase [Tenacibaculum adriaticum]|uniref:histidine kinase n=1 Tax=Tenacibaculum adriaticum TaxID=413713 RepID=A0A5S5DW73_9FLAO|nr:ATP-binding protein [Tenacibaculum adriaticum]TYQ00102.1 histidine kinase/DNA gyrase B/HSP90-like ATPase [Tenacibaculum adriaticum]
MEFEEGQVIVLISTILVVFGVLFIVVLFTVFQRRKNKLLIDKQEAKKKYEKEIIETQIEIREETLRNISWELHDNIGQLLTLAKIQIQQASPENMEEISETISKSLTETRALSKLINPEFINNIKLKEALRLELERFNRLNYIEAKLTVLGEETEINQKHGIIIFRILQEFFSNTIKHSKATNLEVILKFKEKKIKITAQDNGVGFDVTKKSLNGIGIQNIKTRASLINALVKFESKPNEGTTLKINYYL